MLCRFRSGLSLAVATTLATVGGVSSTLAQGTQIPMPAFGSTFNAALTRGYWFQSPANIIITGLQVPDESQHGLQNVEVYVMQAQPPAWSASATGGQVLYQTGVPSNQIIQTQILVNQGDYVGVLGACGDASSMRNSYAATSGPFTSSILGTPVTLTRFLTQSNIVASGGNQPYSEEAAGPIARVDLWYTPQTGTFANFTATPTSGATPLNVQFTDTTFTTNTLTSWAWDLDGDGNVDSNAPNPSFTYGTCGRYDVTLTVTDNTTASSSITKADFIVADPQLLVTADFSTASTGTLYQYAFTDLSVGSPTTWAWDFDGNGTIDSTLQNPTHTYLAGGSYNVTLTSGNACGGDTVRKSVFVLANDECSLAIPVVLGTNGIFSNTGSTTNPADPAWPCAAGGNDVWFRFTNGASAAQINFDTCSGNTSYDTALEIFDATGGCNSLVSLACNDDNCGLQSAISLNMLANQTVLIRVGGFGGATGNFDLNITAAPVFSNDDCSTAIPVTVGLNGPYTNVGATSAVTWPCAAGGADAWFSFVAPCSGTFEVNTCTGSNYDTALQVFDGSCAAGLNFIACNDDFCGLQSTIQWTATARTTYYIACGGFNSAQGNFRLDIRPVGGSGTFQTVFPSCGTVRLSASGSPNVGGSVQFDMSNVTGTPIIWLGLVQLGVPLCGASASCIVGSTFDVIVPAGVSSFGGPIPCLSILRGGQVYAQGIDVGGPGGCPAAVLGIDVSTTETILTTIG